MVRCTEWLVRLGSWMGDARQSSARTAGDVVLVWCPSGAVGDEVRRRPAERSRDRGNPTGRSRSVVSASDGVPWTSQPVLGGWLRHGPRDAGALLADLNLHPKKQPRRTVQSQRDSSPSSRFGLRGCWRSWRRILGRFTPYRRIPTDSARPNESRLGDRTRPLRSPEPAEPTNPPDSRRCTARGQLKGTGPVATRSVSPRDPGRIRPTGWRGAR
jgi:hypothetical protein